MMQNVAQSQGQFPGAIASLADSFNFPHSGAIAAQAQITTVSHSSAPNLLKKIRITGIHRTRNRSRSQSGMRGNNTFISRPCTRRFIICL